MSSQNKINNVTLADRIISNSHRLFDNCEATCVLMPNHPEAWYVLIRGIQPLQTDVFDELWDDHPDERKKTAMGFENRYSQFYTIDGVNNHFSYSGMTSVAKSITEGSVVESFLNTTHQLMSGEDDISPIEECHNSILVNWYDKEHTIGSHSDDERDHIRGLPIFSFSTGGTRRFVFHPVGGGGMCGEVFLNNGDLLVMGGKMQRFFKHSVPAVRKKDPETGRRINVTVRGFKTKVY